MILAERASQVAAITPHRQNIAARHKSPQRLLLNGIECQRRDPPVIGSGHFAARADPCAAEAGLPFFQFAVSETDFAYCHAITSLVRWYVLDCAGALMGLQAASDGVYSSMHSIQ
jgi:hypothetical protein